MSFHPPDAWRVAVFAALVGAACGAGGAVLGKRLRPWTVGDFRVDAPQAGPRAPRAETPESSHRFGTVAVGAVGAHEFVVRNVGETPLTLRRGGSSCSCTVSDFDTTTSGTAASRVVPPGAETQVRVEWRGKGGGGPFRQQVSILTDDPRRPELVFVVEGMVVPTWRVVPERLVLSSVSASAGDRAEAAILTFGSVPPRVKAVSIDHPQAAQFFSLAASILDPDEVAAEPGATGGVRLTVDVKPGLPLGSLRQLVTVVLEMPEEVAVDVPLEGTVSGDLVLAGPGWDSSRRALLLGTVSGGSGFRTRVFLTARGPHRDQVRPSVAEVVPGSLQVTVGMGTPIGSAGAVRIPIDIVVPPGSRAANHLCTQTGPAGRIVLDTGHPDSPTFTIPVCVAVGP